MNEWIDPSKEELNVGLCHIDTDGDLWIERNGGWLYSTDIHDHTVWSIDDVKERPLGIVRPLSPVASAIITALE